MELTEFEKKRAANLIWNAAGNYKISPGFRMYDENGKADLYWNSLLGAVYKNYDWNRLMEFYHTFHETVEQETYENLFWLSLENACFDREKKRRPVFPFLRKQYAERTLANFMPGISESRVGWIMEGHFRRALGQDCGLPDPVDRKLLDAIELGGDLNTEEWIHAMEKTLSQYFTYIPGRKQTDAKKHRIPMVLPLFRRKRGDGRAYDMGPVRRLAIGFGEHVDEYGGSEVDPGKFEVRFAKYTAQTEQGLKKYIVNYFGLPIFKDDEIKKMEQEYCVGNHLGVKLHFTRGEYTPEMLKAGFAGKMRKQAAAQEQKNLAAFEKNGAYNRMEIERLAARIRNSLLMHMETQTIHSPTGVLKPGRIYRALYLNDNRVFDKELKGTTGDITVDIVLDASTSQLNRMETVSAQGYIIAEALTRCSIPTRVYSYSSLNGYTVITLFRDYAEKEKNRKIFRYFTSGANRDGLAIRLAAGMMKDNTAEHRILILLTDVKPNDVVRIKYNGVWQNYANGAAVEDCAAEVHQARMKGISVLCVFTGEEEDLPDVHRIFNRNFVKIRTLDKFADAVGSLIQGQIRRM